MYKFIAILVALAICSMLPQENQACMCYPGHPQQAFCWSDFVIRAGILSDKIIPKKAKTVKNVDLFPLAHYEILVTRVFKGVEKIHKLLGIDNSTSGNLIHKRYKMKVHTAKHDSMCGVSLQKGKKYLLTGYIYGGKMKIGLCNWIRPFRELSKMEHRGIRGAFDCSCSTAPCWGGGHENCPSSEDQCYWDLTGQSEYDACTLKHGMCVRRNNKCTWIKEAPYEECMNSNQNVGTFVLP